MLLYDPVPRSVASRMLTRAADCRKQVPQLSNDGKVLGEQMLTVCSLRNVTMKTAAVATRVHVALLLSWLTDLACTRCGGDPATPAPHVG